MERKEVGGDDLDLKSPHIRLNDREREREKYSYLDIAKSFIQEAGVGGQEDLALSEVYFFTVTNRNTVVCSENTCSSIAFIHTVFLLYM